MSNFLNIEIKLIIIVVLMNTIGSCSQAELGEKYFSLPDGNHEVIHTEALSFVVDTVASNLKRPYSMAFLPDGRMLITERSGNLLIIKNGKLQKQPVRGNIPTELRDIELHPRYEENGWIYLSYYIKPNEKRGGRTVLMRGRLDNDMLVDREVLYSAGPFPENGDFYGSRIAFDHEGYLFFSVGQRGGEKEKRKFVQDLSHYSGKIMRLYDDGRIPLNNPFVDTLGVLPEIYTYGFRQIEGLTLNPKTDEIWSSEHGPMGGDEINIIRAGLNYGWPEVTYGLNYDSTLISKDTLRKGMEPPVHHWTPSIAPSGLDFVSDGQYPTTWNGNLFSGSLKFRFVDRIVIEGSQVQNEERLLKGIGRVRSINFAPDGFLYIMTEDTGLIVRLVPVDSIN